jgi:ribosomal protein L9
MVWSSEAQKTISNIVNPAMLSHYNKKNLRELTKAELNDLEEIKFKVLCNMTPYDAITEDNVANILESNPKITNSQSTIKAQLRAEFVEKQGRGPSMDELRQIHNLAYSFDFFNE